MRLNGRAIHRAIGAEHVIDHLKASFFEQRRIEDILDIIRAAQARVIDQASFFLDHYWCEEVRAGVILGVLSLVTARPR